MIIWRPARRTGLQITSIDRTNWSFKIENQAGAETLGAVHLADRFRAASATDFHVLKHLDVAAFRRRMEDEPVELVADLCRRRWAIGQR